MQAINVPSPNKSSQTKKQIIPMVNNLSIERFTTETQSTAVKTTTTTGCMLLSQDNQNVANTNNIAT